MANDIVSWEATGMGAETQIVSVRIKRVEEISELVKSLSSDPACVRVTKERSGRGKSCDLYTNLWLKEGYVDPFIPVG